MSELDNVTRLKDLNHLSEQAAGAIAAQKILGTVPATVDGGLWREGNALKMKVGAYNATFDATNLAPIPTNLPITISGNVVTVNGLRFQLNGFKNNLTAQNGLLFSDGTQCGVIAVNGSDYVFQMTFGALDTENLQDGDTVSISPLDEGNVTLIFVESDLLSVGKQKFSNATISNDIITTLDDEGGAYKYTTAGYTARLDANSAIAYTYNAATTKNFGVWISFFESSESGAFKTAIGDADDPNLSVVVTANPDYTDGGTEPEFKVTIIVKEALFKDVTDWNDKTPEQKAFDYYCMVVPITKNESDEEKLDYEGVSNYKYEYKVYDTNNKLLVMSVDENAHFDSGTADTNGGYKYTYKADGWDSGYFANPSLAYELTYRPEARGNNGFEITGLIDGLVVYEYNNVKNIYRKSDIVGEDDKTIDESKVASATVYGTITQDNISNAKVTITNINAIATKENGDYCDVQLIDKAGDTPVFRLYFDSSLPTSTNMQYGLASFVADTTDSIGNTYTYVGSKAKGYFSKTETGTENAGLSSFMNYTPSATTADISFDIVGLIAGLSTPNTSVNENGYITRGAQTLGYVDDSSQTVRIYSLALPTNPTPETKIFLDDMSDLAKQRRYKLILGTDDNVTYNRQALRRDEMFRILDATAPQTYSYRAEGTTAGFYTYTGSSYGGISFKLNEGAETFQITSLATGLGVANVGSGQAVEILDVGNNLSYVKINSAALPNGSTTGTKDDIVLTDTYATNNNWGHGYQDGKLFALTLAEDIPQLDANNETATIAAATLTFDSVAGTATYTGTTYGEYYYRVPTTLPAAGSTDTYVSTAKYYEHAGGEQFLISGLNNVNGISQQLVADNITVTETKTLDTLTGAINVNYNFSIGSALKNNLQSGKYITISSRDTQNFSPSIVNKE